MSRKTPIIQTITGRRPCKRTISKVNAPGTSVMSIFGVREARIAASMVAAGTAAIIAYEEIPEALRVNDARSHALFAIVVPKEHISQFNAACERGFL